jgi:hypothetical protein
VGIWHLCLVPLYACRAELGSGDVRNPFAGLGERVILAGRGKDVEERNVTISFSQSPEWATATRDRVPLVSCIRK